MIEDMEKRGQGMIVRGPPRRVLILRLKDKKDTAPERRYFPAALGWPARFN
jgi:hypothetical protein